MYLVLFLAVEHGREAEDGSERDLDIVRNHRGRILAELIDLDLIKRPVDRSLELLELEGLLDVIEGVMMERLDGGFRGGVTRNDDNERLGAVVIDVADDIQPIDALHAQIRHDDGAGPLPKKLDALGAAIGGRNVKAIGREQGGKRFRHALFVVDDEDGTVDHGALAGPPGRAGPCILVAGGNQCKTKRRKNRRTSEWL